MRSLLIAVLLVGGATGVAAQTAPARVTFEDAVARAIDRNPTVAQASASIMRAEALLQQARAVTRPNLSATVTTSTLDTAQGFEGGTTQPRNQVTFAATASMPILAPARWARVTQARDQIDVASASLAQVQQQVAVAAAQAYLAVIAAHRRVEVDERALETAQAQLDYADRRLEGGVGSRLNQLRAAQQVAAIEAQLPGTRLALLQAQEALGVILAEGGPVDAANDPVLTIPGALDDELWMRARPDLLTQGAIIRAAERVVRDSWKDVAPSADVDFTPQYITPTGLFFPARSWRLTVSISQPIFQGGLQSAVKRERQVTFDQSQLVRTELEIQARSEVRLAQAALRAFAQALTSARRAADQSAQVLQITTTAFEVGATTNIEVIDAQRSTRDAETIAAQTEDALQRARLDLLVAIGQFPPSRQP